MPDRHDVQTALFGDLPASDVKQPTEVWADATLSDDLLYRYQLSRTWAVDPYQPMVFIMLNPSTADAKVDDPTIRRCMGFARREGCNGIVVVNLYAFRATKPAALADAHRDGVDVIGPDNDETLRKIADDARIDGRPVVAAWGAWPGPDPQTVAFVRTIFSSRGVQLQCLGRTRDGSPRHPLYLKRTAPLTEWSPR